MPSTFQKVRKHINKKRAGTTSADSLHEFSRDAKRLRKASVRDSRLEKIVQNRSKKEQPLLERAYFFQRASQTKNGEPFDINELRNFVFTYVHQYDEELANVQKARRPGRPPSTQEYALKAKQEGFAIEYKNGFLVPDLTKKDTILMLSIWDKNWAHLSHMIWIRLPAEGEPKPTTFPPKGY